eukprot:3811071-Pyramimonas_sp.AAC.1
MVHPNTPAHPHTRTTAPGRPAGLWCVPVHPHTRTPAPLLWGGPRGYGVPPPPHVFTPIPPISPHQLADPSD